MGDIKGTDKLIPVIDVKFDDCGVKYGWAGNQAVLYADTKALTKHNEYDAFLKKLSELPVPSFLKTAKDYITATGTDAELETVEQATLDDEDKPKKFNLLKAAKDAIDSGFDVVGKVGNQVAAASEEAFRNKTLMKRQMLFYGVVRLYNDGLKSFMNQWGKCLCRLKAKYSRAGNLIPARFTVLIKIALSR